MSLLASQNLFTAIDVYAEQLFHNLALPPVPELGRGADPEPSLDARRAREMIIDRALDDVIRDRLLRRLIECARAQRDPWELMVLWVLAPRLRTMFYRISTRTRAEPADIRSELLLGATLAVREVDLDKPCLGKRIWNSTYQHGWAATRREHRESPRPNDELMALLALTEATRRADGGEASRTAVGRLDGTGVSAGAIRGERLGAVAHRYGAGSFPRAVRVRPRWRTS